MTSTRTVSKDDVRADILEASLTLMNEGGLGALICGDRSEVDGIAQ